MLVICEECAKKYNVDEKQIKGDRARFTCQKCGNTIIVHKKDASASAQPETFTAGVAQALP